MIKSTEVIIKYFYGGDFMRTIIFRGKRQDNGKWVKGDLVQFGGMRIIHPMFDFSSILETSQMIDETIGQFTGNKDKNGKEIFEGDFVRQKTNPCGQNKDCIVEPDPLYDRYEIKWDERRNGWNAFPNTSLSPEDFNIAIQQLGGLITWPSEDVLQNSWHYEIIGNIHDNPELKS